MSYIKVKVVAGAKRESLTQKSADHFEISVKEKAERNMANRRVAELLAVQYEVPEGAVRLVSGHHHPSKIFDIKK